MTEYQYLTEKNREELLVKADSLEIDITELDSAEYHSNIYGLEAHLAVGGWIWDEDEEYTTKIEKLIEYIEEDGIQEYLDLSEDQMEDEIFLEKLQKEAVKFLNSKVG